MDTAEYLHERDIFYVVDVLHRTSLISSPQPFTYTLSNHRLIRAPKFPAQRGILKFLADNEVITIESCTSKSGQPIQLDKGITYTFRLKGNDLLRKYHSRLLLRLDEAHLNHQALTETGTLFLDIDGEYIYVLFPYHRLRINSIPLRANQTPQFFFEYLIEMAKGGVVTRDTFPQKTSRSFEDLALKVGFEGKVRKMFLPLLEKNRIQLLTEIEMNVKDSTEIYRQLMRDEYNRNTYEKYMEGIE